jgi:hypothetical protein
VEWAVVAVLAAAAAAVSSKEVAAVVVLAAVVRPRSAPVCRSRTSATEEDDCRR